jgi:hypothetical protein
VTPTNETLFVLQADGHTPDSFELDLSLNFLVEILLSLTPDQIAQFYLVYDCQPFAENLIGRSFALLIKMSQLQGFNGSISNCFTLLQTIVRVLNRFNASAAISHETIQRSMSQVIEMNENKNNVVKQLITAANDKPKRFYAKLDELFP